MTFGDYTKENANFVVSGLWYGDVGAVKLKVSKPMSGDMVLTWDN